MLIEAFIILLLLAACAGCFIHQKKFKLLQAMLPLAFMPLATLVMHAFVLGFVNGITGWNLAVYWVYGTAAALTIAWVAIFFRKFEKHRLAYALVICLFCALLGVIFLRANLI